MKRYIRSNSNIVSEIEGFLFERGKYVLFLNNPSSNLTDKIARKFINKICDIRGVGDSIRQSALYSADTLKDFKRQIVKATLYEKELSNGQHFMSISGSGFTLNFPEEEFNNEVIVFE